jgi:hypothetical protein
MLARQLMTLPPQQATGQGDDEPARGRLNKRSLFCASGGFRYRVLLLSAAAKSLPLDWAAGVVALPMQRGCNLWLLTRGIRDTDIPPMFSTLATCHHDYSHSKKELQGPKFSRMGVRQLDQRRF